jgi:hypothetical protein
MRATLPVTPEYLRRVGRLARDLADRDVMREAWVVTERTWVIEKSALVRKCWPVVRR